MAKKIKVTHDEEIMGTAKSSLKEELDQENLIVEYGNPTTYRIILRPSPPEPITQILLQAQLFEI